MRCASLQGLGATIIRNTPANSIFLGSFQVLKEDAAKRYNCSVKELPPYIVMGAAGLGGIGYWCSIFPVDVVKSAMMSDSIKMSERKYPTLAVAVQVKTVYVVGCSNYEVVLQCLLDRLWQLVLTACWLEGFCGLQCLHLRYVLQIVFIM